jgi:predicted Zn-dependent peptidase
MQLTTVHPEERCQTAILPNGLTVLLEPLPYLRSVSAGIWIKAGSANETAEQSGISHFLEHLFFKGTSTRSARQLMEAIESHGGHLNAFTSRDYTCVYAKVLDTHVPAAIDVLADIIRDSQFFDFEKERNVILEEIASIVDVPEDYAHDLFMEQMWPGHALGRAVSGTQQSVGRMTRDDVRAYFDTWYRPENMVFAMAGNFDPGQAMEQIAREFQDLPAASCVAPDEPPRFNPGVQAIERAIGQDHLCFGFPGPSVQDTRRYAYDVLSSALGGGSTSRLFDRIRENEGLAYAIYTFHSCFLNGGVLGVYAAVAPENLARTIEICFEELRTLRDTPMSGAELSMNREQLKGNLLMSLEHTFNRMARLAKSMINHNRLVSIDEIIESVDAVTAGDVHQLTCDLFREDQCAMLVYGPTNGQSRIEVQL